MAQAHRELKEMIREGDLLVNRYRIGRRIGVGAYGMIFGAIDEVANEQVAVKAIPPGVSQVSETALARFQRELKVIRNMVHPNLITLYDWGQTREGLIFMILEYIDGVTLDEAVRSGPMKPEVALDVLGQLARALDAAHSQGVIHRDLKPANVMLIRERHGGYKAKVLDFGMAKVLQPLEDESLVDLTREGMAVGTPRYIAPEQARGKKVGPPADLYALGLLFYEMLTGERAVKADSVEGAVMAHVSRKPLELDEIEAVPVGLRGLLMALLEKDPSRRIQSARKLVEVLQRGPEGMRLAGVPPSRGENAGGGGGGVFNPEGEENILATFDAEEFGLSSGKEEGGFLGDSENLELDYDRYQAFAPRERDPIARRKQFQRDRWFRAPRTTLEWVEAGFSALAFGAAFLIVGAQASGLELIPRAAISLAAPGIALVLAAWKHSPAWELSFGRFCWVFSVLAILVAHLLGPAEIADELNRNPTWFLLPFQDVPGVGLAAELVSLISGLWARLLESLVL